MSRHNGHSPLDRYVGIVGKAAVDHYTSHDVRHAPCIVGQQRLSYIEVAARTGLPPGRAARIISKLAADHKARSIRDLYAKTNPVDLAVHGVGPRTVLMLIRLYRSEKLDVDAWRAKVADSQGTPITWSTFKGKGGAA